MTIESLVTQIRSDLQRVAASTSFAAFMKHAILGESFRYILWMRICRFSYENPNLKWILFPPSRLILRRISQRLGISVPFLADVGLGFYVGHSSGVIVNIDSVIGDNCNLSQGVTLGRANRGEAIGAPRLGDRVYVGPGAKIIGAVTIGNDVAIGANAVVTSDIDDGAVAVGIPAKVISHEGSTGYIHNMFDDVREA